MDVDKIEKLQELLNEDGEIIDCIISRLTKAGENYGSQVLAVDIYLKTINNQVRELRTVAKLIPPNEFLQEIFNTPVTFRNEISFYETIVPTLHDFQKEHGIIQLSDFSPKFYGGRLSLDSQSEKVDSGAVILLENLKSQGYMNIDRLVGFDLDTTKVILKNFAQLHGISLALKMQKPKVFQEKIRPYLTPLIYPSDILDGMREKIMTLVDSLRECQPLRSRIATALKINPFRPSRDIFATISCSLLFLLTSIQTSVFHQYYDDLVKFYYDSLMDVLSTLKCNQWFSFQDFLDEIDYEAGNGEFYHIVEMLFAVFAPRENIKELSELKTLDDFGTSELTQAHRDKMVFVVNEFAKRNWI